jgi:hypothetical protein
MNPKGTAAIFFPKKFSERALNVDARGYREGPSSSYKLLEWKLSEMLLQHRTC